MRTYYCYTLNCPDTNSVKYVGISNNPKRRLKEHLEDNSITKKTKWLKSLTKPPLLNIVKKSNNIYDIIAMEIELISKYTDLVNSTAGGEYYAIGKPIDVYSLEGRLIGTYTSIIEAVENLNIISILTTKSKKYNYSSISACCKKKRTNAYGYIWRYAGDYLTKNDLERFKYQKERKKEKTVFKFDQNGNFVKEYKNIAECVKDGFNRATVSESMSGKVKHITHKGFIFCANKEDIKEKLKLLEESKPKKIYKYSLSGEFIKSYNSVNEATKELGTMCNSVIRGCLIGKYKQAKGYIWKYEAPAL
jgi:predicted GIY-YIG superfamily endonuclease